MNVTGDVAARLLGSQHPVDLKNVGPGGCMVESAAPLVVGTAHEMSIRAADGWATSVAVRVAHCRRCSAPAAAPLYAVGFAFLLTTPERRQAIGELVDKMTASLTFE